MVRALGGASLYGRGEREEKREEEEEEKNTTSLFCSTNGKISNRQTVRETNCLVSKPTGWLIKLRRSEWRSTASVLPFFVSNLQLQSSRAFSKRQKARPMLETEGKSPVQHNRAHTCNACRVDRCPSSYFFQRIKPVLSLREFDRFAKFLSIKREILYRDCSTGIIVNFDRHDLSRLHRACTKVSSYVARG